MDRPVLVVAFGLRTLRLRSRRERGSRAGRCGVRPEAPLQKEELRRCGALQGHDGRRAPGLRTRRLLAQLALAGAERCSKLQVRRGSRPVLGRDAQCDPGLPGFLLLLNAPPSGGEFRDSAGGQGRGFRKIWNALVRLRRPDLRQQWQGTP